MGLSIVVQGPVLAFPADSETDSESPGCSAGTLVHSNPNEPAAALQSA
jgi:hypothetical protein